MKLSSNQTRTVLIVEDLDWIRSAMRRALEQHGFNVAEARDDLEALDIAKHHPPDAILTEDSSPIFAALVERVREHPALRKVPIVIVNPDAEEGLHSDGAFVIKDYDRIEPLLVGLRD